MDVHRHLQSRGNPEKQVGRDREDSTNLDVFHLVSGATEANRQIVLAQSQLGTPVVDELAECHGQTNLLSLGDDRGGSISL